MPLRPEVLHRTREETITFSEAYLRDSFLRHAEVIDYRRGYVSVPFVNQEIDPELQGYAADLIAYHYQKEEIRFDKVVGIPSSGIPLAAFLSERMSIPLCPGRKGVVYPGSWKHLLQVEEKALSFTTREASSFVFNGVAPGDRVLLVDDVVAMGDTGVLLINSFRQHGVREIGLALYFAKLFQPGIQRLWEEGGVAPFYAVGIEAVREDGGVVLAPPHF